MCDFVKNFYIYSSCTDPGTHFFKTSVDGSRENACPQAPHERQAGRLADLMSSPTKAVMRRDSNSHYDWSTRWTRGSSLSPRTQVIWVRNTQMRDVHGRNEIRLDRDAVRHGKRKPRNDFI
ncbi:hypothetical protein VSDG_04914 [Cytospora chrysosperma]|uniref:Uncharacterized protein n=1 Tax=Cytospora chrysosperma TaxID=252740 RepID=A0A423W3N6_CYTCH|nr:hypothetical protein VSDG_04914 [Valsa sordida]